MSKTPRYRAGLCLKCNKLSSTIRVYGWATGTCGTCLNKYYKEVKQRELDRGSFYWDKENTLENKSLIGSAAAACIAYGDHYGFSNEKKICKQKDETTTRRNRERATRIKEDLEGQNSKP